MFKAITISVLFALAAGAQQSELDSYTQVTNDLNAGNFTKALSDLDAWKNMFAESNYQNDREALYVQAYAAANQPAKALDKAAPLIDGDLKTEFPAQNGPATILRLLYNVSLAVTRIPTPTADQIATGEKAARALIAWDQPLAGVAAADWEKARKVMRDQANATLVRVAMLPGMQAMAKQPPDCSGAEAAYVKALNVYPDRSVLSWELGRALTCEAKEMPDKVSAAIYEFERAAVVDPTLGGARNDPKQVQAYANNVYVKFHGSDEGLDRLRQLVSQAPLPPAGFAIESADQIADKQQSAADAAHPEAALWRNIKAALLQPDGEKYFENELKGSGVPQLAGKLVEAKPACRPLELLVAVSGSAVEILLKLDKRLAGKPEPGAEFRWEGVPSAFTREPFLLTMDTETASIQGLMTSPCPASVRKR